jgi:ankyrin repeat protein
MIKMDREGKSSNGKWALFTLIVVVAMAVFLFCMYRMTNWFQTGTDNGSAAIERAAKPDKPLYYAMYENDMATVKAYIACGVDLNDQLQKEDKARKERRELGRRSDIDANYRWFGPRWSLSYVVKAGNYDMARLLLENGLSADVPQPPILSSAYIPTPLENAVKAQSMDFVRLLLDHGADPDYSVHPFAWAMPAEMQSAEENTNSSRRTIPRAMYAAMESSEEILEALVEAGGEIGLSNVVGNTILHRASELHRTDLIPVLIEHGADPNARNVAGRTPLHCCIGRLETTKMLLAGGADINIAALMNSEINFPSPGGGKGHASMYWCKEPLKTEDRRDWTVLHCGAAIGDEEYVKLLLEHGAKLDIKGANGRTPLDIARLEGRPDIVKLLEEWIEQHPQSDENPPPSGTE